jgi:hypothetical protein
LPRVEYSIVLMHPASHLRLLTDAYELSYRLLHVQMNNILMLSLSLPASSGLQGYWVPDTFIWAPRLLGSLPHRHGVPTTVHGLVNHRHFKAWKARREEHPAMLDAISINSMFACLPLGIKLGTFLEGGQQHCTLATASLDAVVIRD